MNFNRLKFVNVSDQERQSKKQRANELKLERLINDKQNDNLVETIFPNESKNLVNVTGNRDLTMEIRQNVRKKKLKVTMVKMLPLI